MLQQPPVPIGNTSKILCLTQVVTEDELKDDEDYEDILADMKTECGKFGILSIPFFGFLRVQFNWTNSCNISILCVISMFYSPL